jgi:hypothetical protein
MICPDCLPVNHETQYTECLQTQRLRDARMTGAGFTTIEEIMRVVPPPDKS